MFGTFVGRTGVRSGLVRRLWSQSRTEEHASVRQTNCIDPDSETKAALAMASVEVDGEPASQRTFRARMQLWRRQRMGQFVSPFPSLHKSNPTSELTRRRESKHPPLEPN